MRSDRWRLGLLPLIAFCVAAAHARAGDGPKRADGNQARGSSELHVDVGASDGLVDTVSDPAGDPAAVMAPRCAADISSGICEAIGGWGVRHSGANVYVGNNYRIEFNDVVLNEIQVELDFELDSTLDLYVSIHRALSSDSRQSFQRVVPDCVCEAVGAGTRDFYSCSLLATPSGPLTLEAGYDYLIGVSWTMTSNLRSAAYANDTGTYPQPFVHGTVLERVIMINVSPPVPDELTPILTSTAGVYSMRLCIDPVPGACCVPPDSGTPGMCEERLPADCTDPRSTFHGQRSSCLDGLCVFGACCLPCGTCEDGYTSGACEDPQHGGSWAGADVPCPATHTDLCPAITGACCNGAQCTEVCVDTCAAQGGDYLGNGTTCFPNMCAGACCVLNAGCDDMTEAACGSFPASTFKGPGTTCADPPAGNECGGACCVTFLGQRRCNPVDAREECTPEQGFENPCYMGDALSNGFSCTAGVVCPPPEECGACCLPNGSCLTTSADFCALDARGTFYSGESCDNLVCTACCESGACTVRDEAECTGLGGTPSGPTCVPDPCGVPVGACCFNDARPCRDGDTRESCEVDGGRFQAGDLDCLSDCPGSFGACCRPNGTCTDGVTLGECDVFGGAYQGDGTWCDSAGVDCPRLGACCMRDGACLPDKLADVCATLGGSFAGAGVRCDPDPCPTGACCFGAECTEITGSACAAEGGDYQGDDTTCSQGNDPGCSQVVCPNVEGACCFGGGSCQDLLPLDCCDAGGEYQGPDTLCSLGVCLPGACCLPGRQCDQTLYQIECAAQGGEFHPQSVCTPGFCDPTGACCNNGACRLEAQVNCTSFNDLYLGEGTSCDGDPCAFGACCLPDRSCLPDRVRFLCDGLGGELVLGAGDCTPGLCDPTGACCNNGSCTDGVTEVSCTADGGVYQGNDTQCTSGLCLLGACCHADGTCDDDLVLSQCSSPLDEFDVDFTCGSRPPCLPRGACCIDGQGCVHGMAQQQCTDAGGEYGGHGSMCRENLCIAGACCLPGGGGTCDDTVTLLMCEEASGVYLGPDTCCTGARCERGSCCSAVGACLDNAVESQCEDPADFRSGEGCTTCEPRGACCMPLSETCEILTPTPCQLRGGFYDGDGTVCEPDDLCVQGACCMPDETCTALTRQRCEAALGIYVGAGTDCTGTACARGACCELDASCREDTVLPDCATTGGEFHAGLACQDAPACAQRGACCEAGQCSNRIEADCTAAGGTYLGTGVPCAAGESCAAGACCLPGGAGCSDLFASQCAAGGGTFSGAGEACGANTCISIISSNPPNCAIGAGQPSTPDGLGVQGWTQIVLVFDGDTSALVPADFTVSVSPGGGALPVITGAVSAGNAITLQLDPPTPAAKWTCITHDASGTGVCLGSLPGDADGDGQSFPPDIRRVIDCVNGAASCGVSCELWECDIDRSGRCAPADILRIIDLLFGGDQYTPWLEMTLPACPTAP